MIFGSTPQRDVATQRKVYTRSAVIDQIFNYAAPTTDTPLLLAWRDGSPVDVDLAGEKPNRVGDSLYLISLGVSLDASQVFGDQAMRRTVIATNASQAWGDQSGLYLSRGTMTVENRPISFSGTFNATSLEIALTQGDIASLSGKGAIIEPLPADQQPDQDDPVESASAQPTTSADPNATPGPSATPVAPIPPIKPGAPGAPQMPFGLPALQLFDHVSQQWVEFDSFQPSVPHRIASPERYVDNGGSVLMRFVNRAEAGQFGEEQVYFQVATRVEGTIE
jgi:hypothetical protein